MLKLQHTRISPHDGKTAGKAWRWRKKTERMNEYFYYNGDQKLSESQFSPRNTTLGKEHNAEQYTELCFVYVSLVRKYPCT